MKNKYLFAFLFTALFSTLYTFYTDHRWEDWYITFKASKNLALGNGLTFTVGERVHSFTSPINTLLPAFFAWLFQSNPDEYAIWLYRSCNIIILGLCAVLLLKLAQVLEFSKTIATVLVGLFSFNILIVDNSINGMEAPYMMLFLLLLIYNLFKGENSKISQFAIAFTGLMYTRPDGFIYASTIILGYSLFTIDFKNIPSFYPTLKKLSIAVAITAAFYLPWIIFTWSYYGTPIPHTVTAKGNLQTYDLLHLTANFLLYPFYLFFKGESSATVFFMPAYASWGGWHKLHLLGRLVSTVSLFAFLIPIFSKRTRAISLSAYLASFYLTFISGQGNMPWYLPNISVQIILLFCCILETFERKSTKWTTWAGSIFLGYCLLIFALGAYELKTHQQVIENGNRKILGEWLKENSPDKKSTVFMECLGYIGFYSQLKTFDYPGMSSPEVVQVIKEIKKTQKPNFALVIQRLEPDWVVIRPSEADDIKTVLPQLLSDNYYLAKVFDVKDKIPQEWYLMGKPYLYFDATFYVYKKKRP